MIRSVLALAILAAGFMSFAGSAHAIDFGDDASEWAKDGECDDPRFQGPGMTTTPLLDDDILHDATDCRQAFEAGRIEFGSSGPAKEVEFGKDSSECAP